MLIYITKALSKGNYLYTDTALLSYCYCLTMMSSTSLATTSLRLLNIYLEFQDYLYTLLLLN